MIFIYFKLQEYGNNPYFATDSSDVGCRSFLKPFTNTAFHVHTNRERLYLLVAVYLEINMHLYLLTLSFALYVL